MYDMLVMLQILRRRDFNTVDILQHLVFLFWIEVTFYSNLLADVYSHHICCNVMVRHEKVYTWNWNTSLHWTSVSLFYVIKKKNMLVIFSRHDIDFNPLVLPYIHRNEYSGFAVFRIIVDLFSIDIKVFGWGKKQLVVGWKKTHTIRNWYKHNRSG